MFKIRNWSRFQHYKTKGPQKWVKLYTDTRDSDDYKSYSTDSKLLFYACLQEGGKSGGVIPEDADYMRKMYYLDTVDFQPLLDSGFLVDSDYRENSRDNSINASVLYVLDLNKDLKKEVWEAFEEHRVKMRKPMTDRARELIIRECEKIGGDPNPLLEQSIRNGWQGVFPLKTNGKTVVEPKTCDFESCNRPGTNHHFGRHYCKAHLPL